jgi:hypothetical protein
VYGAAIVILRDPLFDNHVPIDRRPEYSNLSTDEFHFVASIQMDERSQNLQWEAKIGVFWRIFATSRDMLPK